MIKKYTTMYINIQAMTLNKKIVRLHVSPGVRRGEY